MTAHNNQTNVPASAALIREIMSTSDKADNQQGRLIVELHKLETTFDKEQLTRYFKLERAEKTDKLDGFISALSPDYEVLCRETETLKAKQKESKSAAVALQIEGNIRKIKAARVMFDRALAAVLQLRHVNASHVSIVKGALDYRVPALDEEGNVIAGTTDRQKDSCSTVTKAGEKIVRELKGKVPNTNTTVNVGEGRSIVRTQAELLSIALRKNNKPVDDYSDDESAALELLLTDLLMAKFADDKGKIDVADFADYLDGMKHPAFTGKFGNAKRAA